jgi:hypothetical protein
MVMLPLVQTEVYVGFVQAQDVSRCLTIINNRFRNYRYGEGRQQTNT